MTIGIFKEWLVKYFFVQISIKTLQLQRFITLLIITKYDLKFIAICHQLIVAQWLALMATNLKVLGSSFTGVRN